VSDLTVRSKIQDYVVRFRDDFAAELRAELRPTDVVIIDAAVRKAFAAEFAPILAAQPHIEITATEPQKSYQGAERIIADLIARGFRKDHRLVAIGGGITQDVTAFIASILYRGVDWLFFPTTLLAQGDSCIGSKTSINFGDAKNQVGGFYPPRLIVIDPRFLETLPALEIRSGLGEMAHYFLIGGEQDFVRFAEDAPRAAGDRAILRGLISRSLEIKRAMVERDEYDQGPRQIFNYGHTFGHALESITGYRVPHGVAVSYGMDLANFVSVQLGLLDPATRLRARAVLAPIWDGVPLGTVDLAAYERALLKDKKNAQGQLGLILTRGFGDMFKQLVPLDATFSGWLRTWFAEVS